MAESSRDSADIDRYGDKPKSPTHNKTYVIVGGGIAGVSCAEELSRTAPDAWIEVISGAPIIKAVTNFRQVGRSLAEFEVKEKSIAYLTNKCPNVRVYNVSVVSFLPASRVIQLADASYKLYDKLCICTGAVPKVIVKDHPRVIGIRDTESIEEFQKKLVDSRRIMVVGNGGIATELVYEVSGCEVVWAIKDKSIGHTFFDEGAATFFLPHLETPHHSAEVADGKPSETKPLKRTKYVLDSIAKEKPSPIPEGMHLPRQNPFSRGGFRGPFTPPGCTKPPLVENCEVGSALGPDWHTQRKMKGGGYGEHYRHVHVEYECEVAGLLSPEELHSRGLKAEEFPSKQLRSEGSLNEVSGNSTAASKMQRVMPHEDYWPVYVELSNGKVYGCDLVVSATGVVPNTSAFKNEWKDAEVKLKFALDGGIVVDSEMGTGIPNVYAAGDVCTVQWDSPPVQWFPMRLWTQARQTGVYAARCMVAHARSEPVGGPDFCFELFTHITKFFGYKVVLLGRYNAQGLGEDYEILLRCTKGKEYVKVILQHGRMVGAVLIGETDLEETFENLILNQMDLSRYGESLLDPNIDIEDYFD